MAGAKIRRYEPRDREGLIYFLHGVLREIIDNFQPDERESDFLDVERAYTGNRGSFHVLENAGKICGCVGVRKLSDEIAELKRLYIAKELRGSGFGRALCESAIQDAGDLGYQFIRLDTVRKARAAVAIFRSLGFYEIPRYNSDPFPEIFMEKRLGARCG
jgi:ribosomal protein S18 acetylase RimI-like enzyme